MKRRTDRMALGRRMDDMLVSGGDVTRVDDDGTQETFEALEPPDGAVITVLVEYMCGHCRASKRRHVGWVERWEARDGRVVVCFRGLIYRVDGEPLTVASTLVSHTLIQPNYGSQPECMCPVHGPLVLDPERLPADALYALQLWSGQRRNPVEHVTRRLYLLPAEDHPPLA